MNPKRFITRGIVLSRTNFGEADRIITFITPEHGKVRAIAKGSRKQKSKLAGGIEPFSVSDLTILIGRGEIYTLMSSRLVRHYGNITSGLERLNEAAAFMKRLNIVTEDQPEDIYYKLLVKAFQALNNKDLPIEYTGLWFNLQLLKLGGHQPNLRIDTTGAVLDAGQKYNFDIEKMSFFSAKNGKYDANHIKFLRLCAGLNKPEAIGRISGAEKLINPIRQLVELMSQAQFQLTASQ